MPELSPIDPRSAALLVMDYQVDTLTKSMTAAQSADVIACVPGLIAAARDAGMMVIHVVVAFRPGHPEISPRNLGFSALKANGMRGGRERRRRDPSGRGGARGGTDRGQAPRQPVRWHGPGDAVALQRHRHAGAPGVHTSGVVLSTVRHAGALDYRLVVVRDCCADPEAELHAIAARHRLPEAGGRRHHGGTRRRLTWQVFMKRCDKPSNRPRSRG